MAAAYMQLGDTVPWTRPHLDPACAFGGPFRQNVLEFLQRCHACPVPLPHARRPKIAAWVVCLRFGEGHAAPPVLLHVYEERLAGAPRVPVCDACRNMGESMRPGSASRAFHVHACMLHGQPPSLHGPIPMLHGLPVHASQFH